MCASAAALVLLQCRCERNCGASATFTPSEPTLQSADSSRRPSPVLPDDPAVLLGGCGCNHV